MPSPKLILASWSPRRIELVKLLGVPFEAIPSNVSEELDHVCTPVVAAVTLAERKALFVAQQLSEWLVLGCDTLGAFEWSIFGKPTGEEDAFAMLQRLRGKINYIYTGVALIDVATSRTQVSVMTAEVKMRDYSDEEIRAYIKTWEPMDKAWSYAIQWLGGNLVDSIRWSYYGIVGFPFLEIVRMLEMFGVHANLDVSIQETEQKWLSKDFYTLTG